MIALLGGPWFRGAWLGFLAATAALLDWGMR
jgi:hypothetical protein